MADEIIYTEHRKRLTAKISGNASREEIQSLLANWHGIPYEDVNAQEVENAYMELQKQSRNKAEVAAIIEPFYSDLKGNSGASDGKKLSEIVTIGRFIRQINWPIRILECSERPDFIIEYQGRRIGIELTQLYDEESVREIADLKSVVRIVENRLLSHNPDIGQLNLCLDAKQIRINGRRFKQFRKQERMRLADTIYDYVLGSLAGASSYPDFILDITCAVGHPTSLSLSESYWLKNINVDTLTNRIEKKNHNIGNYREIHNLSDVWLVVTIDGACSSSSFNYSPEILSNIICTGFNQIFLYNLFDQRILLGDSPQL